MEFRLSRYLIGLVPNCRVQKLLSSAGWHFADIGIGLIGRATTQSESYKLPKALLNTFDNLVCL